jgi:tRNA(Ile)-lysidine synthase TilS/MesJ
MDTPYKEITAREVERSIITVYRSGIWSRFARSVREYGLINSGDRIAVCISGGKDSMLLAKCMQELKRHGTDNFGAEYVVMDPGYNAENRRVIEDNLRLLDIPATIFSAPIFDSVAQMGGSPCYICARMRRGHLYAKARELGCNKIALAHHFNDVTETIMMGILYNGRFQSMPPKLKSANFEGMELIRPLYTVRERDIINWRDYNRLGFIQCACRFTEKCVIADDDPGQSARKAVKLLIAALKKTNPNADINIFNSASNVNLDTIIGWKRHGEEHRFTEEY